MDETLFADPLPAEVEQEIWSTLVGATKWPNDGPQQGDTRLLWIGPPPRQRSINARAPVDFVAITEHRAFIGETRYHAAHLLWNGSLPCDEFRTVVARMWDAVRVGGSLAVTLDHRFTVAEGKAQRFGHDALAASLLAATQGLITTNSFQVWLDEASSDQQLVDPTPCIVTAAYRRLGPDSPPTDRTYPQGP